MTTTVATVRQDTKRVPSAQLASKGRNHVTLLTDNPAFPDPTPSLQEISDACVALEIADEHFQFNKGTYDRQIRNAAHDRLKQLIDRLAGYVQSRCRNDQALILSAGFNVRRGRQPSEPMPAPLDVRAKCTPYPGRIEVRWRAVKNRRIYQVWINTGDPTREFGWERLVMTTKNHYTVEHLPSDRIYHFRVAALGALGVSPVSDLAMAKAA